MFEKLTAFLPKLNTETYGKWNEQKPEADGTPEHPCQFPFVIYEKVADDFVREVYSFVDTHEDMELNHYYDILEEKGIEWSSREMKAADVTSMDGKTVMALIVGVIRVERFSDGTFLDFLKSGYISKWLFRLAELDEQNC